MGLEISIDAIGNLMMTLPGRDRARRASSWARTSTACRRAATIDGAAGVVAGLSVVSALQARRDYARLRHHRHGHSRRGIRLVRHRLSRQRRRLRLARSRPAWPIARSDNGRTLEATLLERGFDPGRSGSGGACSTRRDPRLPGAAHRAGPDARGREAAGRRGDRHPRLQAIPQRPLHRRVWPFRRRRTARIVTTRSRRRWRCCISWRSVWLEQEQRRRRSGDHLGGTLSPTPPCTDRARSPARRVS